MTTVLEAALAFHDAGCSVIQAAADGTKAPAGPWKQYQAKRVSTDQLHAWFGNGHPGIGLVTGAVSGGLEMLEFEARAVKAGLLGEARDLAAAAGLADVWRRLACGYMESTPSGGVHFLYRLTQAAVPGNTKLARDGKLVIAETRGEGGFVVVAPSAGPVHPTGRPWQLAGGGPASIPVLTVGERQALHEVIRALDTHQPPAEQPFIQPASPPREPGASVPPGEDFNDRTDWTGLLQPRGWVLVHRRGDVGYWRRPDKHTGISATTGRPPYDNLYVFSTSTEFDAEVPYSKFGALAVLEHRGDHKAAAAQLRRDGFGTPEPAITFTQPAPAAPDGQEDQPEHTSWHPRDLAPVLAGEESGDPKPVFLYRDDGACLIYRAKINALIGESESGKTWIALLAVVQAIGGGAQVLYLDFEDAPAGITGRLLALGLSRAQLAAQFRYVAPDEPLTGPAATDLSAALAAPVPDLIVLDGVNAAMTMLGLNLKDNKDATDFSQRILRPLKRTGAAVLTVDHVTKDREGRGNYAIGAQAKRADIDGSAFLVEVVKPFGRGLTGKLRMTVSKDRPGHVRAISAGARNAGTAVLTSRPDGGIDATIENPDMRPAGERPAWRPTGIMERVSQFLENWPDGLSTESVRKGVSGKAQHINIALEQLAADGFITRESSSRNSIINRSARPYREISEHQIPPRPDLVPTSSPSPGTRSSAGPDDLVPRTPSVTTSQGGRDEVSRTDAQDELTGLTSSPGAAP